MKGFGQLTLSSTDNNYRGGVSIEAGILSIADPKVLGSPTFPIRLQGSTLQVRKTLTLKNPMVVTTSGTIDVPKGVVLNTHGKISGSGFIGKTGDGLWNHYGDCLNSVDIRKDQEILHTDSVLPSKRIQVDDKSIFQGCSTTTSDDYNNKKLIQPALPHVSSLLIQKNYKSPRKYYF